MQANLYALGAIALWASLASLGVSLQHVPPFLLTGIALVAGSTLAWPHVLKDPGQWRMAGSTLCLGVFTLFGFHFLLFIGLRMAPAVEVNLVNYLWPLFIVVLAPLYLPGVQLRAVHVLAALLGFAGAAMAILGGHNSLGQTSTGSAWGAGWGYLLALGSAAIWANYSLQTKRMALAGRSFPSAAIGLFGLVSGLLSLLCHWALEPAVSLSLRDWLLLALMGLGPLGAAFFLWDKALKLGDARQIGILSYLTPLGSTVLLMLVSGRAWTWSIAVAAFMIVSAAVLGTRAD
ncbi:DMT family transporter [Polaromonas sp. SM01]|uniref:DMT family transporter n=1 Tax=Polaromonas sp. SM01 TaxID=3085630 RepID=UPI002981CEB8|nr:DMT family transporter [Polaromonas sp. SM01]MDW5442604.1 DMT family transporter [Polaromonas sp. SM01]